jgi:hypothetical protein
MRGWGLAKAVPGKATSWPRHALSRYNGRMKSPVDKLLHANPRLVHSKMLKVDSHVQRESGEWILNTLMIEGYSVPFRYRRKQRYRSLQGARVNLTYYPDTETVAGIAMEVMKVVRIKLS